MDHQYENLSIQPEGTNNCNDIFLLLANTSLIVVSIWINNNIGLGHFNGIGMRAVSLRVPVKLVPRAEAQKRTAAGLLLPIWILDPSSLRSDYKSPSQAVSVSSTDHVENRMLSRHHRQPAITIKIKNSFGEWSWKIQWKNSGMLKKKKLFGVGRTHTSNHVLSLY